MDQRGDGGSWNPWLLLHTLLSTRGGTVLVHVCTGWRALDNGKGPLVGRLGRERAGPCISLPTCHSCPHTEILHAQRDTLIQYLLDELDMYETDHSDALAPRSRNADESLMGEHSLVQPATVEAMQAMAALFDANMSDMRNRIVRIEGTMQDLISVVSTIAPLSQTTNVHHAHSANPSKETRTRGLTIRIPPLAALLGPTSKHNTAATDSPSGVTPTPSTSVAHPGHTSPSQSHAGTENPNASMTGASTASSRRTGRCRTPSSHSVPTAGLVIPDVPVRNPNGSRRPKSESWRDIIKHWTEGDPSLGLRTPLRDWPPDWTRGSNRLFAAKYHQRSLVALEFLDT